MKVHQIISEAEIKEWNPIDAVKKKLGSKTAATKMDIDAETKELAGEFTAFYKNTPDGAPTTGNLFDYLKKKGLPIGSEQDIIKVLDKLGQRFGQKVSGALGKAKDYAGGKVAGAKAAVGRGIDKVKQAGAKPIQPNLPGIESTVYESAYNILKEEPLQPADVTRIINHYVKSGFAGTAGGFGKSKYAGGKAKAAGSAVGNTGDPQLDKAIELVQANGYQVTK